MKKILGIVVLGLLYCNVGTAEILDIRCKDDPSKLRYSIDTSKKIVKAFWTEKNKKEQSEVYDLLEIDSVKAIYQGRGKFKTYKWQFNYGGDGLEFRFEPEYQKLAYCNSANEQKSNNNTNDKIAQSKQICKDLGFKVNTEKFADCALKMMSMQFQANNTVVQNDGSTKQEIIIEHRDSFDAGDFLLGVADIIDKNYGAGSKQLNTNNYNSRGQRCAMKQYNWGVEMVCQ